MELDWADGNDAMLLDCADGGRAGSVIRLPSDLGVSHGPLGFKAEN